MITNARTKEIHYVCIYIRCAGDATRHNVVQIDRMLLILCNWPDTITCIASNTKLKSFPQIGLPHWTTMATATNGMHLHIVQLHWVIDCLRYDPNTARTRTQYRVHGSHFTGADNYSQDEDELFSVDVFEIKFEKYRNRDLFSGVCSEW